MTTIWIDPTDLRAGATLLGRSGVAIRDDAAAVHALRNLPVPAEIAGRVAAEFEEATAEALRGAIALLQEAIGIATRAQQIEADQAVASTTSVAGSWTAKGWQPVYTIASGPLPDSAFTTVAGAGAVAGGGALTMVRANTPSLIDVTSRSNNSMTEMLRSRPGASYNATTDRYTDRSGFTSSSIKYNASRNEYETR